MRFERLLWDKHNVDHIFHSHGVTVEEVEEIILGGDGETSIAKIRREGRYLVVSGATASGRLLKLVAEELDNGLYVFSARDMTKHEKRRYRRFK